ncbi:MAG: flagellar filament capping protein FliD [Symbiobacterium sp.]|uniref:flagellar filament capping protein FliD n=1 Tax=Symbiobacterium sp. TaxID=1971213 RepID=UPI0034649376
MRLGGLISGTDTETLISALMELERTRIYRQENQQVELQQKQKAWRDVRSLIQKVQDKLDPLRLPTIFRSRKVTVSDDSVLSVTAEPGAAQTSYTIKVNKLAQSHMVASRAMGLEDTLSAGRFQIGDDPANVIEVEAEDTLSTLAAKINRLNAGVTAHVVSAGNDQYRIVLTSTKSGAAHRIQLSQLDGGATLQDLELVADAEGEFRHTISAAQDAEIELNGDPKPYTSSTNTFSNILPGITITVKKPSSEAVTVTVDMDAGKVVQAVKDWVSALNTLQDQLKTLSAYDSEKKTAGILNGDSLVRSIQFNLRDLLSRKVESLPETLNMLSQVGIGYGAYGSADYGKIVVDETKLKAAIERDPEAVAKLFNAETGPIAEMNAYIKTLLDSQEGPFKVRDESLTKQINRITETIERLEYQLELREQTLRRQFQQMEEVMAKLQSQGNYFMMQLFGGMFQSQ